MCADDANPKMSDKQMHEVLARWFEWVSGTCQGPRPSTSLRETEIEHRARRRHAPLAALDTPSEVDVAKALRERYPSGATFVVVSYHTNPLYAIKERVGAEEGIDIDSFDQGGQGTYQERLAFELAERFGLRVLSFTLARSFLTKEQYLNLHPLAPVVPVRHSGRHVEDESGLVRKEDLYFIIDELVDSTVVYLVENGVQVDFFSGHYATGMAAAYRLSQRYGMAVGRVIPYSTTTHSLGWDRFVATHDTYTATELRQFNFDHRLMEEKRAMQEADLVITVAPDEIETVAHPGLYDVSPEKVVAIPGGVDTRLFHPYDPPRDQDIVSALRRKHGIGEDERLMLLVGRLWDYRRKGVDTVLETFARMRQAMGSEHSTLRLALVGVPPRDHPSSKWRELRQELESLVRKSGVESSTLLVEMVPHEVVPAWLHATALSGGVVLALPRVEPWGLMNLEAMATGNIVVTINRGGPPNYIQSGHDGLLVDRDDPEDVVRTVAEALRNEDLASRMRENAHHTAAGEYSWAGVARRFLWAHLKTMAGENR
jgi:glycosyltransferase involved in cell wall biosynthesis